MSKAINYAAKRLASLDKPPKKCTDDELKNIMYTYTSYLSSMCDVDGYLGMYERVSARVSPWFLEAERRGVK